jgi:hypothetical protein
MVPSSLQSACQPCRQRQLSRNTLFRNDISGFAQPNRPAQVADFRRPSRESGG